VRQVCPARLETPGAFPVADFFEFVLPANGVVTGVDSGLPTGVEGLAAPGENGEMTLLLAPPVYADLWADDGRARFTVAHEVGHIHLHVAQTKGRFVESAMQDFQRTENVPVYKNPEWQANVHGATLLMPESAVLDAVRQGMSVSRLARVFGVSKQAMEIRLNELT
jgi:hypothetical protein